MASCIVCAEGNGVGLSLCNLPQRDTVRIGSRTTDDVGLYILPHYKSLGSNYINFKYFILKCVIILLIHNIYHTLANSHSLSTYELALEADCTEGYEMYRCKPIYYKRF